MSLLCILRPSTFKLFPKRLLSTNGKHFLDYVPVKSRGGEPDLAGLKDKALLIYFSAGWCPSCKLLTPKVKKFYEEAHPDGLEVLWISKDKAANDQLEYYEKAMPPWLYVPYEANELKDFFKLYEIKTIPALRLVDPNGHVVDEDARVKVENAVREHPEQSPKQVVKQWMQMLHTKQTQPLE